jgi:hypothetical protein
MNQTTTPLATIPDAAALTSRIRSRYHHTCGQMIWVVELPQGFACFAELRPVLPPPITTCPRCGALLTREALTQRQHDGA